MDTILAQSGNRRHQRRSYTEEDKEHLIAICNQPGVSTAFVARQHDINANLYTGGYEKGRSLMNRQLSHHNWTKRESPYLLRLLCRLDQRWIHMLLW